MELIFYFLIIAFAVVVVWKGRGLVYDIYNRTIYYETYPCQVKIIGKNYRESTKSYYKKRLYDCPEEFNVYVEYKGKKRCINDEKIFKSYNIGDNIYVIVREAYNRKNEIKYTLLRAR